MADSIICKIFSKDNAFVTSEYDTYHITWKRN